MPHPYSSFGSSAMYEARLRILTNLTQQVLMCPTAWNLLIPDPQTIVSPQDIVSCSNYSQGCEGGFAYLVGKYGEDFGLVAEECYPYAVSYTHLTLPTIYSV